MSDAHLHIASFLKSTRRKNAESKREKLKEKKDPKFLNAKGEFRSNFSKKHWDLIYQSIPETTILNIIYRLRIKANYHDMETFINADINFEIFHKCLSSIINYLNYIHEAYIFKVIGKIEYDKILYKFPSHLNEDLAKKRYLQFGNN